MNENVKKWLKPKNYYYKLRKFGLLKFLPDVQYLKINYFIEFGEKLDLDNPKTFNEKMQWLKLYDRKSNYTIIVDKYRVRKYVERKIGEEYLIPLYGVWRKFDDIKFDELPNEFVVKCNHDSGGLVICKNKNELDIHKAKKKINKSLNRNFYWVGREWPYKNVKPLIIAEKYMTDEGKPDLTDYKFYCFNGKPKFLYASEGLTNHQTAHISFLELDWKFSEFKREDYPSFDELPKKPKMLDEMIRIAGILSEGIPFVRIDLYEIENKIYFSEITFTPSSGFMHFEPEKYDKVIGDLIKLP